MSFITSFVGSISVEQWTSASGFTFTPSRYSSRSFDNNGDVEYSIIIDVTSEGLVPTYFRFGILVKKDRNGESVTPLQARYLLLDDDVENTPAGISYFDTTDRIVIERTSERMARQYDEDKYVTFPQEQITIELEGQRCTFTFNEFQYTMPRYMVPITLKEGTNEMPYGVTITNPTMPHTAYYAGTDIPDPGPAICSSRQWLFTGWYADYACTQKITFPYSMPRTKELTMYSGWKKRGNIRFKSNGQWSDGYLKIKVDGQWLETDAMLVKADGQWKEFT